MKFLEISILVLICYSSNSDQQPSVPSVKKKVLWRSETINVFLLEAGKFPVQYFLLLIFLKKRVRRTASDNKISNRFKVNILFLYIVIIELIVF